MIIKVSKFKKFKESYRGFEILKNQNNLGLWRNLREEMLKISPISTNSFSKFIFGEAAYLNADLILHQYCTDKLIKKWLNNKLLQYTYNKKKIIYPLPNIWQEILINHSISVNKKISSLYFYFYVLVNYFRFIFIGISKLFIFPTTANYIDRSKKNIHFVGLNRSNLPKSNIPKNNYDIVTWYIKKNNHFNLLNILHDVDKSIYFNDYLNCNISYKSDPTKYLYGIKSRFKYFYWLIISILISLKDLFFGKWHHAFLLGEAVKSKITSLNNNFADTYLFQFSAQSYRPMWTYLLESKKIDIICYFYSTSEQPMISSLPVSSKYDFYLYNWPISYCWDNFQLDMIRKNSLYHINGIITGPIWFSDNSELVCKLEKPFIVIFDIPPHRKYFHFGTSTLTNYYEFNDDVHSKFLQDIVSCATELEILVVHKVKRDIGIRAVKSYTSLLRRLSNDETYNSASPDISPIKLIDKSVGVISMPFTSTAIYGKNRNKPSIYYDPVNWIKKNDIGAHNIPIIFGKEKLKSWLSNILLHGDN